MTLRRVASYLYIVAALAFIALKWKDIPHALQLVRRGMVDGYMILLRFGLVSAGAFVAISMLRRRQFRCSVAQSAGRRIQHRNRSLEDALRELPTIAREAFGRRPIWASILSLFIIIIPVLIVFMAHAGGLKTFGLGDWIFVVVMELPMIVVACVVLAGVWSRRGGK